jgi:ferredoxin
VREANVAGRQISEMRLPDLFDEWRRSAVIYGPRGDASGRLVLGPLGAGEGPIRLERNFDLPPALPVGPGVGDRDGAAGGRSVVIFGLRPCDAAAMAARRDSMPAEVAGSVAIVSLACVQPRATCFCVGVGGGPADAFGSDAMAFDLGAEIALVPYSDVGERLLGVAVDGLVELGPDEAGLARDVSEAARERLGVFQRSRFASALDAFQSSPTWAELERVCRACEVCARLCPLPLARRPESDRGRAPWRSRLARMLSTPARGTGAPTCVGCGRCTRSCPTGIDLRIALRELESPSLDFCDPA